MFGGTIQIKFPLIRRARHSGQPGQIALEFMGVLGFLMVFFVIIQVFANREALSAQQQQTAALAQELATQWSSILSIASTTNGFYWQSSLPAALDNYGTKYVMWLSNTTVEIDWNSTDGSKHTLLVPMQIANLTNSTGAGRFQLTPGNTYKITGYEGYAWVG